MYFYDRASGTALQYKEKKGDADSGEDKKELKNIVYSEGLYRGKDNEKLWKEVKEYIEKQYETEAVEKICFQSDGGGWMKKGSKRWGQNLCWMNFISGSI